MSKTAICRILPTDELSFSKNGQAKGGGKVVTLDVYPASGAVQWQLCVAQPHDLKLQTGDRIKCASGAAVVLINPGTQAGAFVLFKTLPSKSDWKFRTELEISDETISHIQRGSIQATKDIGNIIRATSATTR